jgi:predicted transcriptional regulator
MVLDIQNVNIKDKELFNMLMSSNGGKTRIRIIDAIILMPSNANQLSKRLNLDYKTITYHLDIICNHRYATKEKFDKQTFYYPSDRLIKRLDEYILIKEQFNTELGE